MNDTRGNEAGNKDEANNGKDQVGEFQGVSVILVGCKNIIGIVRHFSVSL